MNNKVLIGIVVVVVIVILALVFMKKPAGKDAASTNSSDNASQQSNTPPPPPANAGSRSLKDLLGLGTAQTCTYSDSGNTGTVYVANGKSRMDTSMTSGGQTMVMHAIMDGNTYYSWMEGQKTGFKMTVNANGSTPTTGQASGNVDVNKAMNYNCSTSGNDSSKFALPSGVTFTDYSSIKFPSQ